MSEEEVRVDNEVLHLTIKNMDEHGVWIDIRIRTNKNWLYYRDLYIMKRGTMVVTDNIPFYVNLEREPDEVIPRFESRIGLDVRE